MLSAARTTSRTTPPSTSQLLQAFGAPRRSFAHIPLILNKDGSKMSKRNQGASLTSYQEEGFLPEAVVNYLCLLGWSPKDNREKMTLAETIERFDLPQILRHNARLFRLRKAPLAPGRIRPPAGPRPLLRTGRPRLRPGRRGHQQV